MSSSNRRLAEEEVHTYIDWSKLKFARAGSSGANTYGIYGKTLTIQSVVATCQLGPGSSTVKAGARSIQPCSFLESEIVGQLCFRKQ